MNKISFQVFSLTLQEQIHLKLNTAMVERVMEEEGTLPKTFACLGGVARMFKRPVRGSADVKDGNMIAWRKVIINAEPTITLNSAMQKNSDVMQIVKCNIAISFWAQHVQSMLEGIADPTVVPFL